jgi:hypothetical protein
MTGPLSHWCSASRVVYSDVRDRQLIETFVQRHRDGDATLTHHLGLLALAYYGDS